MKKILFPILLGMLFFLPSCESEVFESNDSGMLIEQNSPVKSNNEMKLSAKVSLPKDFNRQTAAVGFYVAEYHEDYYGEDYSVIEYDVVSAYTEKILNNGYGYYTDGGASIIWVDDIDSDGTFSASFIPKMQQYICVAFAVNILDEGSEYVEKWQTVLSKAYFFAGEASIRLEEHDPWGHRFSLTYSDADNLEVGLCWSSTNQLPNIEDTYINASYSRVGNNDENDTETLVTKIVGGIDFGDNDVVYVRGVLKKEIESSNTYGESYKTVYSNVIEYHPKDLVKEINTMDDIRSLFVDSLGNEYTEYWNTYRGKLIFNYEVQKHDWLRLPEDTTNYFYIDRLRCTIHGKGKLPYIYNIEKSAAIKGMEIPRCDRNSGVLEDIRFSYIADNEGKILKSTNVYVDFNRGELSDSKDVYVNDNYGLVRGCTDIQKTNPNPDYDYYGEIMNRMVYNNQSLGKIIDCKLVDDAINSSKICGTNYGYIENCTPDSVCCQYNYGVIKEGN